jgi:hypothetical protein
LTSDGLVEIEKIKTGDSVWSYNIESGRTELALVQNIFERSSQEFVKLYFAKDSVICTFEHPFFVNQTWLPAKDLKQGDSLFAFSGEKVDLDSTFSFRTETATAVYNLEAAGNHNYYVSARGVLVHNQCAPSFSGIKNALNKVYEILGGPSNKMVKGKFGSPQHGSKIKGYRLDPPHPNAPKGSPESGWHINYWDYTKGKRGKGGVSGAIRIID